MKPPSAPELSPEELEAVEALEREVEEYLDGAAHDECHYNTNTSDQPRHVWEELVRRARKAGYIATMQGAMVVIKKPARV